MRFKHLISVLFLFSVFFVGLHSCKKNEENKKSDPVITWYNPADIYYGTLLGEAQLNAVADVPGSFVYNPPAGTLLEVGDDQVLNVEFTPDDVVNYNTASLSVSINVVQNNVELPIVSTKSITDITQTTAVGGGAVSSDSGDAVTVRGVCWSTNQNPTINDNKTNDGSGTGDFSSNITELAANTSYYVKAYATNSAGTAYGEEVTFTSAGIAVTPVQISPSDKSVGSYWIYSENKIVYQTTGSVVELIAYNGSTHFFLLEKSSTYPYYSFTKDRLVYNSDVDGNLYIYDWNSSYTIPKPPNATSSVFNWFELQGCDGESIVYQTQRTHDLVEDYYRYKNNQWELFRTEPVHTPLIYCSVNGPYTLFFKQYDSSDDAYPGFKLYNDNNLIYDGGSISIRPEQAYNSDGSPTIYANGNVFFNGRNYATDEKGIFRFNGTQVEYLGTHEGMSLRFKENRAIWRNNMYELIYYDGSNPINLGKVEDFELTPDGCIYIRKVLVTNYWRDDLFSYKNGVETLIRKNALQVATHDNNYVYSYKGDDNKTYLSFNNQTDVQIDGFFWALRLYSNTVFFLKEEGVNRILCSYTF